MKFAKFLLLFWYNFAEASSTTVSKSYQRYLYKFAL